MTITALDSLGSMAAGSGVVGRAAKPAMEAGAASFGTMLEQAVGEMASSLRRAETVASDGIAGTAGFQDVVEAVMTAEQSLQAGIGIRDRIVNAYLEVSRMAI